MDNRYYEVPDDPFSYNISSGSDVGLIGNALHPFGSEWMAWVSGVFECSNHTDESGAYGDNGYGFFLIRPDGVCDGERGWDTDSDEVI